MTIDIRTIRCQGVSRGGQRCRRVATPCEACDEVYCLTHTRCGHRVPITGGRPRKSETRPCTRCGELKPVSEYYRDSTDRRKSYCKTCAIDLNTGYKRRLRGERSA